jgi:hypothetical protein
MFGGYFNLFNLFAIFYAIFRMLGGIFTVSTPQ